MRKFINFLFMTIFFLSTNACAMGGRSVKPRKPQDKMWHLCHDWEMQYHGNQSPIGKACNNTCTFYKKGSCRNWQRNMKDLTKEKDFTFFRDGAFILIDEDILRGN